MARMRRPGGGARTGVLRAACVLAWLTAPAVPTAGQEPEDRPGVLERAGITGSVRAGYWSSTRNLDARAHLTAGMFWVKAARPISERVSFLAEGWGALRGPAADVDGSGELREAFVRLRLGALDVRVGRQIVAWGRADGINPTDNLSGEDLTLLAPDDDDRRLGTTAVRASYYLGDMSVSGLWLPEFRPHRFPLPSPPPGLAFVGGAPAWPGDQWAVRVEQAGGAVDWSASYFRGLDLFPDLGLRSAPDPGDGVNAIALTHHRIGVVGADMATSAGRFGLRAEGAYVHTEDPDGLDPSTKNPFLVVVAGADRTFREHLNVNVQYVYRHVFAYRPLDGATRPPAGAVAAQQDVLNSQTRRAQHGLSFRVTYKWLHDTLEAECAAIGFLAPDGLALRPRVTYAVSDRWKALAGAELYRGEATALFGLLRPNSTAYVEMRWSY